MLYQLIGLLELAAQGEVLGLAEEGLNVAVVGLEDGVEVLLRVLVGALPKPVDLAQGTKHHCLSILGYSTTRFTALLNVEKTIITF